MCCVILLHLTLLQSITSSRAPALNPIAIVVSIKSFVQAYFGRHVLGCKSNLRRNLQLFAVARISFILVSSFLHWACQPYLPFFGKMPTFNRGVWCQTWTSRTNVSDNGFICFQAYASHLKDFIDHMGITILRHFKVCCGAQDYPQIFNLLPIFLESISVRRLVFI